MMSFKWSSLIFVAIVFYSHSTEATYGVLSVPEYTNGRTPAFIQQRAHHNEMVGTYDSPLGFYEETSTIDDSPLTSAEDTSGSDGEPLNARRRSMVGARSVRDLVKQYNARVATQNAVRPPPESRRKDVPRRRLRNMTVKNGKFTLQ